MKQRWYVFSAMLRIKIFRVYNYEYDIVRMRRIRVAATTCYSRWRYNMLYKTFQYYANVVRETRIHITTYWFMILCDHVVRCVQTTPLFTFSECQDVRYRCVEQAYVKIEDLEIFARDFTCEIMVDSMAGTIYVIYWVKAKLGDTYMRGSGHFKLMLRILATCCECIAVWKLGEWCVRF